MYKHRRNYNTSIIIKIAHRTGLKVKDSPLCKRRRNVRLSTGKPRTHEYTCFRKGTLNTAEVMRQLTSLPILPGRRLNIGLKANTAYGSYEVEGIEIENNDRVNFFNNKFVSQANPFVFRRIIESYHIMWAECKYECLVLFGMVNKIVFVFYHRFQAWSM